MGQGNLEIFLAFSIPKTQGTQLLNPLFLDGELLSLRLQESMVSVCFQLCYCNAINSYVK